MKYRIVLTEPRRGGRYTLDYAVDDHPAARKWALLTKKAVFWGLGKGRPAAVTYTLASTEADLISLITEINLRLRLVRDEEPDLTLQTLDQSRLNRIHALFHFHEEAHGFELFASKTSATLRELNILVHRCESAMSNLSGKARFQSLGVSLKHSRSLPLEEDDYGRLTLDHRFGDLFMGYSTVGKSLPHCFQDDDMELVRGRRVRPKVTATPEIIAIFPGADTPGGFEERRRAEYAAWCERNRVRDFGYDHTAKLHRPGLIRVGRLLNDLNFETSGDVLRTYSSVSHVLLEA